MLVRHLWLIFDFAAAREAARLIRNRGHGALDLARHAVRASGESGRKGFWTRVLVQVEARSNYRPW